MPAPKVEPPEPVAEPYQLDPEKHALLAKPVSGRLSGKPFTPQNVLFRGNVLTFRSGSELIPDQEINIQFQTASVQSILPLRLQVNPSKPTVGGELSMISVGSKMEKEVLPVMVNIPDKYAMTLELSTKKEGKVSGRIHLCLPDDPKSYLQGSFEAVWLRPFGGPLDADEVPYFQTRLPVPPKAESLRFGYLGETATGEALQCSSMMKLKDTDPGVRIGSSSGDVLGRGDLFAGLEKGELNFDASRLKPGRYLIWVKTDAGQTAFSWQTITEKSQATVKLEFPKETGSLEARVPEKFEGKVSVTPVDPEVQDPKKEFAVGVFNPIQVEATVEGAKATLQNLQPGKYRFRLWKRIDATSWSGGEGFIVEVKTGPPVVVTADGKKS